MNLVTTIKTELNEAIQELESRSEQCSSRHPLPLASRISEIVEGLRAILFPKHFSPPAPYTTLESLYFALIEQIHRGLCFACTESGGEDCPVNTARVETIAKDFFSKLSKVRRLLNTDVRAAYDGDPAAKALDEIVLCYPGILAITNYRIAHELYSLGVPLIPRIITELAHSKTGIDIHPGARISEGFFIDHGTGVVVGETTIIGKNVRIYQGVTLGAKSISLDPEGKPIKGIDRHPIVEDDVIIYSEATLLGRIVIGRGSIIGGNVWITHDIPPGSRIRQMSNDLEIKAKKTNAMQKNT